MVERVVRVDDLMFEGSRDVSEEIVTTVAMNVFWARYLGKLV